MGNAGVRFGTRTAHGRRGFTPGTALRLGKFFGTSPDLWMNLQLRWDLVHAQQAEGRVLERIKWVRVVPRRQTFYGVDEIFVREPGGNMVGFAAFASAEE